MRDDSGFSIAKAERALADSAARFDNTQLPQARLFNPWIVALVVTMGTFMETLDSSIANVSLPHIAGSLSASLDEGAWVLSSYLVANAVVIPISAWISSILGRKRFFLISVFFFTVFSAACGMAPTFGMLILFRVGQGLAGGGLQPSVQAILADAFPNEKRGMAMAVYTVAILCAPVLGPTLGGWITDNFSWRWIFYINIPVGLLCVILTRIMLQDPPHVQTNRAIARKLKVDWGGLALVSIGLATLEIVLDKGQELDWFSSQFIVVFFCIAVVALVGAVVWELNVKNPVVNLRLFKERNFLFCCVIVLGLYSVLYATTYLLPLYMQQMMGYDATTAGMAMSPAGLFAIVQVPFVGYLLTKGSDARKLIATGMVIIASGIFWMSTLNLGVAERNIIVPRIVQVLGIGLVTVPLSTIVFRFLPKTESSQAAGLYALMRNEGGSLGIALASTMLQRRSQVHQQILGEHITAYSSLAQQYIDRIMNAVPGNLAERTKLTMALLYGALQRQAMLLSYMEQFRMLCGIMLCMLPLVLFLKRPPAQKQLELDSH